jgi:hypothetical protein
MVWNHTLRNISPWHKPHSPCKQHIDALCLAWPGLAEPVLALTRRAMQVEPKGWAIAAGAAIIKMGVDNASNIFLHLT